MPVIDATGWTALLLGLFAVFAAIGALRQPGAWQKLVGEVERSPALQMISGVAELASGAAIYLVNPWVPTDILACIMKAIGGLMMIEALVVVGFSDIYFHFWLKNLAFMLKGWAIVSLLAGAALALGLCFGASTQAHASDVRVFVSLGDVMFSAGRPYHRHHHHPLHVVHAAYGPQYYYVAPPPPPRPYHHHNHHRRHNHHYSASAHHHAHGYHYRPAPPPPPPRPGYHRHRPGY